MECFSLQWMKADKNLKVTIFAGRWWFMECCHSGKLGILGCNGSKCYYRIQKYHAYSQWQNVLTKVRKISNTGQGQKTLITTFERVLIALVGIYFLEGGLSCVCT